MAQSQIDALPGFRRRILIEPGSGRVTAMLEDDYHRMTVTVAHDGGIATAVSSSMPRVPWTTCPGAELQLSRSFTGWPLAEFGSVGERVRNCTHLHDLALLAAAHAADAGPTTIDILVSDAVDGIVFAELQRNGATVMRWRLDSGRIAAPGITAGRSLHELSDWIAGLDTDEKETARLLRWGTMLANGRTVVVDRHTKHLPQGRCYSFQPEVFALAERRDEFRDFSMTADGPLADRP